MKRALRILAVILVLAAAGFWVAAGANRGWTKNRIQIKTVDPLTGLDEIKWKDQFVPGVEFLGAAGLGAAILAGASFLFRRESSPR
jgi:hypothetical protein